MNLFIWIALAVGVAVGEKIVIGTNNPKKTRKLIFLFSNKKNNNL
jgi:hypothetical protein